MTTSAPDEFLDIRQLSEWLGIAMPTIYTWRHRGEGPPAYKLNNRVRFRRSDVELWLEDQREQ